MVPSKGGHWFVDQTKILTVNEIKAVLEDVKRRAKRSVNSRQNLIIFRLSTCCGLRVSEIAGLRIEDIKISTDKPHVHVRKETSKGGKGRKVPLWFDAGTLADIAAWREFRLGESKKKAPFVCTRSKSAFGNRIHRSSVRDRFKVACKCLGEDRLSSLTIHDGRHSYCSHAVKEHSLAEVRDAVGHASVTTTNQYLHIAVDDDGKVGNLFG